MSSCLRRETDVKSTVAARPATASGANCRFSVRNKTRRYDFPKFKTCS